MYHGIMDKTSVSAKMRHWKGKCISMNNEQKNTYVRKQITNALIQMQKNQKLSDIKIRDLCNKAEVGRASFYRNFDSKEEVLKKYSEQLIIEWGAAFEANPASSHLNVFGSLFSHYKDNAEFYTLLCRNGMSDIILNTIKGAVGLNNSELSNQDVYSKAFLAYGIYGWVREWIERGMQESAEEINQLFISSSLK